MLLATVNTYYDVAAYLLDKGADPNLADNGGRTPLYAAANLHSLDATGTPARRETSKISSMDLMKLLVAHKADVNAKLKRRVEVDESDGTLSNGATPFLRAARGADLEVMRFLLENGADPNVMTADKTTAIMIAAGVGYQEGHTRGTESDAIEFIKVCMSRGGDINAVNDKGDTPLHGAAFRGADEIARFLAASGAKLDAKNKQGLTAYDFAVGHGVRVAHPSTGEVIKQFMPGSSAEKTVQNTVPKTQ